MQALPIFDPFTKVNMDAIIKAGGESAGLKRGKRYNSSLVHHMKNKRLFILSLIVLSVISIGIQETHPTPIATGFMIIVLVTTVFHIFKEALGK
ncbi:hypothetical protein ACSYGW_14075 [Bacillus glycinifermentans]|uniref:hypothetical protein n=1 Tax=Bacillus glycinifermentans TaxID=1664069 RepID=UPI0040583BAD